MENFKKYSLRIIALPFVFGLLVIVHCCFVLKRSYHFLKYGGEFAQYDKDDTITIKDVYDELKTQHGKETMV